MQRRQQPEPAHQFGPGKSGVDGSCSSSLDRLDPVHNSLASGSPSNGVAGTGPKHLGARRQQPVAGKPSRERSPGSGSQSTEDEQSDDQAGGCDGGGGAFYQVIWCDQRAFKLESASLREQLAIATGVAPKAHKTAEKCIRLLRKKRRAREKRPQVRPLNIFIASWANAPALVQYLAEDTSHVEAKVVVLCDTCGPRVRGNAQQWSQQFAPLIAGVAATWVEAVDVAAATSRACRQS